MPKKASVRVLIHRRYLPKKASVLGCILNDRYCESAQKHTLRVKKIGAENFQSQILKVESEVRQVLYKVIRNPTIGIY